MSSLDPTMNWNMEVHLHTPLTTLETLRGREPFEYTVSHVVNLTATPVAVTYEKVDQEKDMFTSYRLFRHFSALTASY
jgi:hypothetical protein